AEALGCVVAGEDRQGVEGVERRRVVDRVGAVHAGERRKRQAGRLLAPGERARERRPPLGLHELRPLVRVGGEEEEPLVGKLEALLADPALSKDEHLLPADERLAGDRPLLQRVPARHADDRSARPGLPSAAGGPWGPRRLIAWRRDRRDPRP